MGFLDKVRRHEALIAAIGPGHVGFPRAVRFDSVGFSATGLDLDARFVADLNAGRCHVQDVPAHSPQRLVGDGHLVATTDHAVGGRADAAIVCVPTPPTMHCHLDMSCSWGSLESAWPYSAECIDSGDPHYATANTNKVVGVTDSCAEEVTVLDEAMARHVVGRTGQGKVCNLWRAE